MGSVEALAALQQVDSQDPVPMMAYYYIWYNVESWNRAKSDYPILGLYSSDDRSVMEQHVQWAKEAGIDGFIVSWKSTQTLNRRLEQLMDVAEEHNFHLWIIYQGLDFERHPLPIQRIDHDLDYFVASYANHAAFRMYDKPVIIWSGTWEFSPQQISSITSGFRHQLYILASERNADDYLQIADSVDGNAYYWSSVNPLTFPTYQEKLSEMGAAIHDHGGLWIAPAAPGFDARLVGGERVIERNDGQTLQLEVNAALRSSPDAIGLISWNEFSENSHVEPSQNYGTQALDMLGDRRLTNVPGIQEFDSSAPGTTSFNTSYNLIVMGGMLLFFVASIGVAILQRTEKR